MSAPAYAEAGVDLDHDEGFVEEIREITRTTLRPEILSSVGGFAGLAIVHQVTLANPLVATQKLDVVTMLGFVILVGIVVNNAILIVHQALNNMRDGGLAPRDAITLSVRTRIRPIFMTALTSVCGMSPLVLMTGAGSELYKGLGSVVVGGLLVSTLFTLVLVPALFSLFVGALQAIRPAAVMRTPIRA